MVSEGFVGGMVDAGRREVRANIRAAAAASAYVLNSAVGVTCLIWFCLVGVSYDTRLDGKGWLDRRTFPGISIAPPITTTSFARRNVSGSSAAARARFVSGPTATIVTVSGSFSLSILRISWWAGFFEVINKEGREESKATSAVSAAVPFFVEGKNRDSHVCSGVK